MEEKEKYINALKKRALGYEFEEVTTLIEETPNGTKKKISRTKKHIPADVETAKFLLKKLKPTLEDFETLLKDFNEELEGVINANKKVKD